MATLTKASVLVLVLLLVLASIFVSALAIAHELACSLVRKTHISPALPRAGQTRYPAPSDADACRARRKRFHANQSLPPAGSSGLPLNEAILSFNGKPE